MKYRILKPVIDGYNINDIIEREPHVMAGNLEKGEVEAIEESKTLGEVIAEEDAEKIEEMENELEVQKETSEEELRNVKDEKLELIEEAKGLGLKADKRMGVDTLKKMIEEKKSS